MLCSNLIINNTLVCLVLVVVARLVPRDLISHEESIGLSLLVVVGEINTPRFGFSWRVQGLVGYKNKLKSCYN